MKISYKTVLPFMFAGASLMMGCKKLYPNHEVLEKDGNKIAIKYKTNNNIYFIEFDTADIYEYDMLSLINKGDVIRPVDIARVKQLIVPAKDAFLNLSSDLYAKPDILINDRWASFMIDSINKERRRQAEKQLLSIMQR